MQSVCSLLFLRSRNPVSEESLVTANRLARKRGPDSTSVQRARDNDGWHTVSLHNLLDISGRAVVQPVFGGGEHSHLSVLFNGEIYNFREIGGGESDTSILIPAFVKYGSRIGDALVGEFSIVVFDRAANALHTFTDPFLTKPLYWGTNSAGEYGVSTNASALRTLGLTTICMEDPNSSSEVKFQESGFGRVVSGPAVEFDIRQTEKSYSRWEEAFLAAVEQRGTHGAHKPTVFLSSGYDSGAICLALNRLGIDYETISICANENAEVLRQRIEINGRGSARSHISIQSLDQEASSRASTDIQRNVEPFQYTHEDMPGRIGSLQTDGGAIGGGELSRLISERGGKVVISGSGADEIISDYGFGGERFYSHSEFGGLFPDSLEGFFPWKKFYGDSQRSYLFKDEYILGRFGLEGRFPFLDRNVVQEFLSLVAELKNRCYKAPIEWFLRKHDYPVELSVKRGFSPSELLNPQSAHVAQHATKARQVIGRVLSMLRLRKNGGA